MKTIVWLLAVLVATTGYADRPNIVLIMADDVGFSDIEPFGAEIRTPHLQRLADQGVRLTQFYNMAKCETTRAALHTGLFVEKRHAANAVPLAHLLGKAGYRTAMFGKEHFASWVPPHVASERNFGETLIYQTINPFFEPPDGKWRNPFRHNGQDVEIDALNVAEVPFYKTDVLTDYAVEFLRSSDAQTPFFLYLPYHIAHYPLQARARDIARYRGKYRTGWDELRRARLRRLKELGIIATDVELPAPESNINRFRGPYRRGIYDYRPWDTVEAETQDALDLEMAVFAAMMHRLDENIGRLLDALETLDRADETIVLFFSDNGSCPYDSNRDFGIDPGGPASYRTLSAAWAQLGNTPYRYYKQYGHEGGGHTHFIASWPARIRPGISHDPAHVVDLYPTLLHLAEASYPSRFNGEPTPSLDGGNLIDVLTGGTRPSPDILISGFTERFRSVRFGDEKIVRTNGEAWQRYDLSTDPTETVDLSSNNPARTRELVSRYRAWVADEAATMPQWDTVEP